AVTEEAHSDRVTAEVAIAPGGTGRDRDASADYAVGAEHTDREVDRMHRATLAATDAVHAPEQFGHHAVDRGALGDQVTVTAMRRSDPVARLERGAGTDGDRLLTDVEVHESRQLAA